MDAAEKLIRETFGRIPPGRLPGNGVPGPLKQRQLVSLAAYLQHTTCSLCHTLWPLSQQSGTQPWLDDFDTPARSDCCIASLLLPVWQLQPAVHNNLLRLNS